MSRAFRQTDTERDEMADTPVISVIVCTYNRANLLNDVIETVCAQNIDPSEYEVIIVDNNSTDGTSAICHEFTARLPNVRYCLEHKQGLSHARNRGWQEAKGTYLAFIDDDCKVPVEWLSAAKNVIAEHQPEVFGGPYFAFYNAPKPDWYKNEYGSHVPHENAMFIDKTPQDLHGGNLVIRRDVLMDVGGFDPCLGMNGENLAYGEETALIRHIRASLPAARFYYDPSFYVYHLVRPIKTTWIWLIQSNFTKGRSIQRVFNSKRKAPLNGVILIAKLLGIGAILLFDVIVLSHFRDRKEQPFFQQYVYESSLQYVTRLGTIYERI